VSYQRTTVRAGIRKEPAHLLAFPPLGSATVYGMPSTIPQAPDLKRDIELLYELGTLRHIQRVWEQMLGPGFANLAEHHFRLAWIAMTIGKREGADLGKVARLALVHDVAESRTGDVHYVSRQYTERNEHQAIRDTLAGTALEEEFVQLWDEYEAKSSLEAKCVKDADNLDVNFELRERAAQGNTLDAEWRAYRDKMVYVKLYTQTARDLWHAVANSNPNDWHTKGKNRFTAGDWKPASANAVTN